MRSSVVEIDGDEAEKTGGLKHIAGFSSGAMNVWCYFVDDAPDDVVYVLTLVIL